MREHRLECGCVVGYEGRRTGYGMKFSHCDKHGASERRQHATVTYPVSHLLAAEVMRLANVRKAAIRECADIVEDYGTRANLAGQHVQNDTARFLADALRALLGGRE